MERNMLKEAGPVDWFNSLGQDQRYALAGSLIGGGAMGGLNMLRNDRKKRFRNFLAGAAAGGLGGAAVGFGASRLAGGPAGATPPDPAAPAAPAPSGRPRPVDIPAVAAAPRVAAGPPATAPEAAAVEAVTGLPAARVGAKGLIGAAGGAATGTLVGAEASRMAARWRQQSAVNANLTAAPDAAIAAHRAEVAAQRAAANAGGRVPATYFADADRRLASLRADRATAAAATPRLPLSAALPFSAVKPLPGDVRPAPGGSWSPRVPGLGRLGLAGRAPAVGGLLGLLGGLGVGVHGETKREGR